MYVPLSERTRDQHVVVHHLVVIHHLNVYLIGNYSPVVLLEKISAKLFLLQISVADSSEKHVRPIAWTVTLFGVLLLFADNDAVPVFLLLYFRQFTLAADTPGRLL